MENKLYRVLLLHPNNWFSSVAFSALAEQSNIKLFENEEPTEEVDFIISVCYPDRITKEQRDKAKIAALNIHTGLLPEQRGTHPLNWAIIWGNTATGITLHHMVDSYDAGDVVMQKVIQIGPHDTIRDLRKKCRVELPMLIRDFFMDPEGWLKKAWQQNQADMTYAQKRRPEDSELCLSAPAEDIYNLFRSCDPDEYPAFVMEDGVKKIVERVEPDGHVHFKV